MGGDLRVVRPPRVHYHCHHLRLHHHHRHLGHHQYYHRQHLHHHLVRMVYVATVIMGRWRDRWCTVGNVHVLTMYHASSARADARLARLRALLAMYGWSDRVMCLHARWLARSAQRVESLYWSSKICLILGSCSCGCPFAGGGKFRLSVSDPGNLKLVFLSRGI